MCEYDPADWWKDEGPELAPEPEGVYVSIAELPDGTYVRATCNAPISLTKEGD